LPDSVSLFINGFYKGDLQISSADVATVDLHAFPELAALHKPLKLTFKYHDAYAYSLLPQAEVERIFEQSAPAAIHTESHNEACQQCFTLCVPARCLPKSTGSAPQYFVNCSMVIPSSCACWEI
jgi:hypothetical protein